MSLFSPSDLPEQRAPRNPNRPDGTAYIYPANLAERLRQKAGTLWAPANGTEFELFEANACADCSKMERCTIALATMAYSPGDREYPRDWRISEAGQPQCTSFKEPSNGQ